MDWVLNHTDLGNYEVPNNVPDEAKDAVNQRIDELHDQLIENTRDALVAQMHEAYNRGYIDGIKWSFDNFLDGKSHLFSGNDYSGGFDFMSPTYNIGCSSDFAEQQEEQSRSSSFMSPTYNVSWAEDEGHFDVGETRITPPVDPKDDLWRENWEEYLERESSRVNGETETENSHPDYPSIFNPQINISPTVTIGTFRPDRENKVSETNYAVAS